MRGAPDPRPRTTVEVLAEILQVQGPPAGMIEANACEVAKRVESGAAFSEELYLLSEPLAGLPLHLWLAAYYLRRPAQLQAWEAGYQIEGRELMEAAQRGGDRHGGLPTMRLNAETRQLRLDYPDGYAVSFERAPIWQPSVPGWPTQWPNSWRKHEEPQLVNGIACSFDGRPLDVEEAHGPVAMEHALGALFPWDKGRHFAKDGQERAGAPADEGPLDGRERSPDPTSGPTSGPSSQPEAPTPEIGARGELTCVTCPNVRVSGPALQLVERANSTGCPTCRESDTVLVTGMGRVLYEGVVRSKPAEPAPPSPDGYTREQLEGERKDALRLIAKEVKLTGFTRWSKAKLVECILNAQG